MISPIKWPDNKPCNHRLIFLFHQIVILSPSQFKPLQTKSLLLKMFYFWIWVYQETGLTFGNTVVRRGREAGAESLPFLKRWEQVSPSQIKLQIEPRVHFVYDFKWCEKHQYNNFSSKTFVYFDIFPDSTWTSIWHCFMNNCLIMNIMVNYNICGVD